MKYQVLENNKPCDCNHHQVDISWQKSTYDTFEEALRYARMWIAPYGGSYDGLSGIELKVNEPYVYCSFIEIREME